MQDDAYLDSAMQPAEVMSTGSGRKLDQQDRVLPSIESPTYHVDPTFVRHIDNGFITRPTAEDVKPHTTRQNMPILLRSGHSPVVPRIVELDEYDDTHLPKRRRVTDLAYRPVNQVPVVTSTMAQSDLSGSRPGRVEWVESGLATRRLTHTDTIRLHGQEPVFQNQRNETHDRVQTTIEPAHQHGPFLRSVQVVDTDQQYQGPYRLIPRSIHDHSVRDTGYENASSGQRADRPQILLEPRAARLPEHRREQCDTSFRANRLPEFHEAYRASHSTQLVRARLRDEDRTDVHPMYIANSQTNTSQALHYIRIPEGDQSRPIYLDESVQLTSGDSVRREASTRATVSGAKDHVLYEQLPDDEHFAGKPYPIHRQPATQRPPALASELQKVENYKPALYYTASKKAAKAQALLQPTDNDTAFGDGSSNGFLEYPSYIPLQAEQRR